MHPSARLAQPQDAYASRQQSTCRTTSPAASSVSTVSTCTRCFNQTRAVSQVAPGVIDVLIGTTEIVYIHTHHVYIHTHTQTPLCFLVASLICISKLPV